MGCLLELVFEIFIEGIFELIGFCYIKLMQLVVPSKTVSEKAKRIIKNTATTIAALLGVVLIIGLILLVQEDPFIKVIGKHMTYIPLILMVLQITVGIILKIVNHLKNESALLLVALLHTKNAPLSTDKGAFSNCKLFSYLLQFLQDTLKIMS